MPKHFKYLVHFFKLEVIFPLFYFSNHGQGNTCFLCKFLLRKTSLFSS